MHELVARPKKYAYEQSSNSAWILPIQPCQRAAMLLLLLRGRHFPGSLCANVFVGGRGGGGGNLNSFFLLLAIFIIHKHPQGQGVIDFRKRATLPGHLPVNACNALEAALHKRRSAQGEQSHRSPWVCPCQGGLSCMQIITGLHALILGHGNNLCCH